jgi:hypothetical protein
MFYRGCGFTESAAFLQFSQEFVGRHKERILLNDAADDGQRMGPHDVDNDIPAKLCEIVCADDWVEWTLLTKPQVVRPGLVLQQVATARSVFQSPLHMG